MTEPVEEVTVAQLHLLRCLRGRGIPAELLEIFLNRCGASREEWNALTLLGWAVEERGRFLLTKEGEKRYRKLRETRYF